MDAVLRIKSHVGWARACGGYHGFEVEKMVLALIVCRDKLDDIKG